MANDLEGSLPGQSLDEWILARWEEANDGKRSPSEVAMLREEIVAALRSKYPVLAKRGLSRARLSQRIVPLREMTQGARQSCPAKKPAEPKTKTEPTPATGENGQSTATSATNTFHWEKETSAGLPGGSSSLGLNEWVLTMWDTGSVNGVALSHPNMVDRLCRVFPMLSERGLTLNELSKHVGPLRKRIQGAAQAKGETPPAAKKVAPPPEPTKQKTKKTAKSEPESKKAVDNGNETKTLLELDRGLMIHLEEATLVYFDSDLGGLTKEELCDFIRSRNLQKEVVVHVIKYRHKIAERAKHLASQH
jgi:hypothetical protein